MRFSSIQAGQLYMLHITEHCMSGTCRKISVVLNGGLGRSRMSASTKSLFIMPFVVH